MTKLTQSGLILFVGRKPGSIGHRLVRLKQRQPLVHQLVLRRGGCFLLEENRAHRLIRNGVVFLAEKTERFEVEILEGTSVEAGVLVRVALPDGRASDTVGK